MQNWTLDQLKSVLSKNPKIKGWCVVREHTHRRERYFMMDGSALGVDQDRETRALATTVRLFVDLGREGRQGEIVKKLVASQPLDPQIESAISAAKNTDHQAWSLPASVPQKLPELKTADPRMAEDMESVMRELTSKIEASALAKRDSKFNSAELFLSLHDRELHLSNGLVHRSSQSRIYTEAAFSMAKKGVDGKVRSDEYLKTQWSVQLVDVDVAALFDETAESAEKSLDVAKPETGKYAVIVDAEVLSHLFHAQATQLSAKNQYNRLPFVTVGSALIPEATGDLITLTLDPTLDYGADTAAISEQGVAQAPLELVRKNQVMATMTEKQYSDYLGTPTSPSRGNLVVDPGVMTYAELTKSAPKVIEILQFSGLFSDPNSGTFSSEIRLARLYDNVTGKTAYLKGGSVSGAITQNFKGLRLSRECVRRAYFSSDLGAGQGYFGPSHAVLSEVSIVG